MDKGMLPLDVYGVKVHAGFWPRFGANFIDGLVALPVSALLVYLDNLHRVVSFFTAIPIALFFWWYQVYFHARWGATLGKMATHLKVTRLDGTPIGYREALKRFSVDAAFGVVWLVAEYIALARITTAEFNALAWYERDHRLNELMPAWSELVFYLWLTWFFSELVVLLTNKRRRALHDFIAGTVVIRKDYAKPPEQEGSPAAATQT